jgi:dTDP-4-amino-4,6-dideoxygalactose transaminase
MPDVFYDYEILWSGQPLDLLTGESKFHNRFRKGFMEYLEENEDVYYKEISSQEIIKEKKIKVGEDSVSDEFYKQIMTLPISTELTEYLIKYLSEYED